MEIKFFQIWSEEELTKFYMGKYKAILFDFDGVIGKTMDDNYAAWEYAFSKYNTHIDKNEYFLLEGFNTKRVAEHFLKGKEKKPEIINDLINLKEKYYSENNNFSLYEGVESLISGLKKKGYLLGLVSGGSYARLFESAGNAFIKKFNVVITGDKVNNSKPHPEPHLKAAKAISITPSECLVIENAPVGIKSAKKAGMYCVAVCTTLDKKYLQNADKIVNDILELEGVL